MIRCPVCDASSSVKDSRVVGSAVRRRRACDACDERWTTYEVSSAFVCYATDAAKLVAPIAALATRFDAIAREIATAADDYEVERYGTAAAVAGTKAKHRKTTR